MISLKLIPLSFITSKDEIIRQIKNTVVFSHLFESCKETTFNDYIETTQYGFTASALESGSHRMLRITDIHHSKVNWESVPFCDCLDDEKYLLKDNDILVARTGGTTGKSFFVNNPPSNAVFASYLIRIRLKKGVDIDFINSFLNSYCFWSQIVEMKAGSAQPNVNAEKLKTLLMPDCDLETQENTVRLINEQDSSESIHERINQVETLFWNNDKISTELGHQLALLKELQQAYLREAMQGKLVPQDPTDEPAEILLEKIKAEKEKLDAEKRIKRDKPLPPINPEEIPFEIPSNWTWCRFGEVVEMARGRFSIRPRNDPRYFGGEYPFIQIGSLDERGSTITESSQTLNADGLKVSKSFRKGTIAIAIVGGTIANLGVLGIDMCFTDSIVGISPTTYYNQEYVLEFLRSKQSAIKAEAYQMSGQPNIKIPTLANLLFPLPPLAEQERIVAKLEKLMKFCDELEASIKQGINNADLLLQTALREAVEPK